VKIEEYTIKSLEHFIELWTKIYSTGGKPDWSHIIPYYDDSIHFRDTVQEVNGIEEFKGVIERLTKRSKELEFKIVNAVMNDRIIFMEWEMNILFRRTKKSTIYGASRILLNENGKIIDQRDYYDLWGDIFDNIPLLNKLYRKFMKKVFG
jgi:limonene-1,2-epoxide hydrolase